jgi:phosphoribosylanthranilate isomerase
MTLWIKICGIRDVATAQAACEAGASAIGLVFAESPRRVSLPQAREIIASLPDSVETFAVVRGYKLDDIRALLAEVNVDVLQIHCDDGMFPDFDFGVEMVPAIPATFLKAYGAGGLQGRRFIVDSPFGAGTGKPWDFSEVARLGGRMILAGGLDTHNVARAIAQAQPWGIDVSSGVESARGVKDVNLIRDFIRTARQS